MRLDSCVMNVCIRTKKGLGAVYILADILNIILFTRMTRLLLIALQVRICLR